MKLAKTTSFYAFGKKFTFETHRTMQEAFYLAADCDSQKEFQSLLAAEEVDYTMEQNDSTSYYQMSLL